MLWRQTKRSLLLFVLASLTLAHAQDQVPNEIFQRTLLIRSDDEQATALKLDQGGRIYLVTTRRLARHLPLNKDVIQVWPSATWTDFQTARTRLPPRIHFALAFRHVRHIPKPIQAAHAMLKMIPFQTIAMAE